MKREISIGGRMVGTGYEPFLIAEMSGNHNQSLDRAFEIVDAAAQAGANAIKLQTYTADTMTLNLGEGAFRISDPNSLWTGVSLYDLYKQAHTPWEWHQPIMERATSRGLLCFSSPFDATAVDFLESLNVPAFKIASFENTDIPLIRKAAKTGKPIIISIGMASAEEVQDAVDAVLSTGNTNLILLKCTSSYPAEPLNSNISTITDMVSTFGCVIGLSDHTMGNGVASASIALGASVIEKHFTLRRADGGVDSAFSMEPEEFKALAVECRRSWEALGSVHYGPTSGETASLKFRRSVYVVSDLEAGDVLDEKNLRCIRPGEGLSPKHYEKLLGRKVTRKVSRGTPATWDMVADHANADA